MDTVRRLHVLRHAKSSWEDRSLRDHARPLAPRGITATLGLRRHLQMHDFDVSLVLCSTAERTRQTWDGVRAGIRSEPEVRFVEEIYDASPATLRGLLRGLPAGTGDVLLIGHNPGVADLVADLAADGAADALSRVAEKYPTGALASLRCATPWPQLAPGSAYLEQFIRPRDLPG